MVVNQEAVGGTPAELEDGEFERLKERTDAAIKKRKTRTRIKTLSTLCRVDKLRKENAVLEDKITGLKRELDLLKELFMSHAGTKSMKRLTEVDLEVLLARAAPSIRKKGTEAPATAGRSREQIEQEVQMLLGQESDESGEESDPSPQPPTPNEELDNTATEPANQSADPCLLGSIAGLPDQPAVEAVIGEQSYTLIEQVSTQDAPSMWAADEATDAVVVTITNDGQSFVAIQQQHLHDIIDGEMLMLD